MNVPDPGAPWEHVEMLGDERCEQGVVMVAELAAPTGGTGDGRYRRERGGAARRLA